MKAYIHKVNYYETDKMGITHHSNYVRFMEEARVDFLEQIGWNFDKLENMGIASPVISIECKFIQTTTFPQEINIFVSIEKISACKIIFAYDFKVNEKTVFEAKSSHCFLDEKGVPVIVEKRFPDFWNDLKRISEEK